MQEVTEEDSTHASFIAAKIHTSFSFRPSEISYKNLSAKSYPYLPDMLLREGANSFT